jgi:hypothetical protein
MKRIITTLKYTITVLAFASCIGSPHDSPQSIVDTYAQSLCDMDYEGMMSCFEFGDETIELMQGLNDENVTLDDLQTLVSAAKESELIPEISYEIIEERIDGEKGTFRIRFDYEFDDGEEVHKGSNYENIPVYYHDGQWWIGGDYTNKEREFERRMENFFNKLR